MTSGSRKRPHDHLKVLRLMTVQGWTGASFSSLLWSKKVLQSNHQRSNRAKNQKKPVLSKNGLIVYQQMPPRGVAKDTFNDFFSDIKYYYNYIDSGETIEQYLLTPPEVRFAVQQNWKNKLPNRPMSKPRMRHAREGRPYYGPKSGPPLPGKKQMKIAMCWKMNK